MSEEDLRKYYEAFSDALLLMKNWRQVQESHIVDMVKKHDFGIMNRLFCLVIWTEIKKIKLGGKPITYEQYKKMITEAWMLFKKYCNPVSDDEYWDGLIETIEAKLGESLNREFCKNLFIYIILEEIERIWRNKKAFPVDGLV